MVRAYSLLDEPLINAAPCGVLTLPGVLAALARDGADSFSALRPHQVMFWHMFLVQLAALALHGAGCSDIPEDEREWAALLRRLTADFPDDEPWCLVVDDWAKPAFMQPPVPEGMDLKNEVPTPDALDLLITSKNHDIKQAIARDSAAEDWVFALVSLQTGEGYGGAGNQGIARMNGGSSSRPMLTLAPLPGGNTKAMAPRSGAWFRRDLRLLLDQRSWLLGEFAYLEYPETGGLGLTWLAPWPEDTQLETRDLDLWFIEVCRRVRLAKRTGRLSGVKGTSKATRINAKHLKGALGDPWAPVHKTESKSFTLAGGDFDYRTLVELMLSGDWEWPLLAEPAPFKTPQSRMTIVAMALARGNSKTEGFKSRIVPIRGTISRALGPKREELHQLAQAQAETIASFDKALSYVLALAAAGGEREKIKRELYVHAQDAHSHLDRFADSIFFEHLWQRFEAQEEGHEAVEKEQAAFARLLWQRTQAVFELALPAMPCPSFYRHRAEARARRALNAIIRKTYPELFPKRADEREAMDAA